MTHPSYPKNSAPHPVLLPTPLIKSEQLSTAKVKALSLLERWEGGGGGHYTFPVEEDKARSTFQGNLAGRVFP